MQRALLTFAHRQIWRRLPRNVRRAALLRGASWIAPRATPNAKAQFPIIVAGPLRSASGLGEGARACHDAMKNAGLPVYGIDLSRTLLYDHDYPDFMFEDGRSLTGAGTLFLHVGGPLVPLAMLRLGKEVVKHKHIVAHWVWELPKMPDDWRLGVPFIHEVWAPSRFAAEAVATIVGDRPVHVLPHPLTPPKGWPRAAAPESERPFTVLVILNIASSFERKNPCAAIMAFRQAFGDDPQCRLIVKHSNASAYPKALTLMAEAAGGASNVTFLGEVMDVTAIDGLYREADVVMSLHRAEGFGLVIAEAMLRGLPVVGTDWSGSTDFLTRETGIPIGYELAPAKDPQDTYEHPDISWADPKVEEAVEALRALKADTELRTRLGRAALSHATELFSPKCYGERAKALLAVD